MTDLGYEWDESHDEDFGTVVMIDVENGPVFLTASDLNEMLEALS